MLTRYRKVRPLVSCEVPAFCHDRPVAESTRDERGNFVLARCQRCRSRMHGDLAVSETDVGNDMFIRESFVEDLLEWRGSPSRPGGGEGWLAQFGKSCRHGSVVAALKPGQMSGRGSSLGLV